MVDVQDGTTKPIDNSKIAPFLTELKKGFAMLGLKVPNAAPPWMTRDRVKRQSWGVRIRVENEGHDEWSKVLGKNAILQK